MQGDTDGRANCSANYMAYSISHRIADGNTNVMADRLANRGSNGNTDHRIANGGTNWSSLCHRCSLLLGRHRWRKQRHVHSNDGIRI